MRTGEKKAGMRLQIEMRDELQRMASRIRESAAAPADRAAHARRVESDPEQTYFCTCYGTTDVESNADPTSRETILAKQHDQPVYVVADGGPGRNIRPAPVINHSDAELELIETIVGRRPPFLDLPQQGYPPRNPY